LYAAEDLVEDAAALGVGEGFWRDVEVRGLEEPVGRGPVGDLLSPDIGCLEVSPRMES
jgi:hypothetical protein